MAKVLSGATKYRVLNGINFPRPGRPRTGPGSTDEVRYEPGPDPVDIPADIAGAYLASDGNRPPDIEVWAGQVSVPGVAPEQEPAKAE